MPLTRLVNTAIDAVAAAMDATIAETAKFAETDLVCYRAGDPETLVAAQAAAWDPVLAFARQAFGARFICAEGVIYVEQPQGARDAVRNGVAAVAQAPDGALRLAALSLMTNLTGSVLLSLAVVHREMTAEAAWAAGPYRRGLPDAGLRLRRRGFGAPRRSMERHAGGGARRLAPIDWQAMPFARDAVTQHRLANSQSTMT